MMRVGIAADHGGFGLKQELLVQLRAAGHEVVDFGAHHLMPDDDYPDFVIPLAHAVATGKMDRGVAICGSGGILYLIFDDIAPRAHLKHRDFPAIEAVSGFLLGLVGTMLVH